MKPYCKHLRRLRLAALLGLQSAALILLPISRAAVVFTNLFTFDGTNGQNPAGILLPSADGGFYGTTQFGRVPASVFHLTQAGSLEVLAQLYFTNGINPTGPLVRTAAGNLYGTTTIGGPAGWGTVFKISPDGTFQSIASFGGTNGSNPQSLVTGTDGLLYGVTLYGGLGWNGMQNSGFGTIFRIDSNDVFTTVFEFNGTNGIIPVSLVPWQGGVFYGITANGGTNGTDPSHGYGTFFKMGADGQLVTLYSFDPTNGFTPNLLTKGAAGNLYGVCVNGGAGYTGQTGNYGTFFEITTNGGFLKLADCTDVANFPFSILQTSNGTLYGTVAFPTDKILRIGSNGQLQTIYDFGSSAAIPFGLMQGTGNSIIGETHSGGAYNFGTVFRLDILPDPPVLQLSAVGTNAFNFTWNASVGSSYQLQFSPEILQPVWTNVSAPIVASNGTISVSQPLSPTSHGFFRVVLLP